MPAELLPAEPDLHAVTNALVESYSRCGRLHHLGHQPLPNRGVVVDILDDLHEVLFPGYGRRQNLHAGNIGLYVGSLVDGLHDKLTAQIVRAMQHERSKDDTDYDCGGEGCQKAADLLRRLPYIRQTLERDVEAAFRGDPAARSHHEIVFCYPGLEAIAVFRVAHELYRLGVPFIPRMMTEHAHSKTGIDIHPGATIGPGFFIDHGTGVVIGETCDLGENVKLYQGVTLGALSFDRDESGELVHGTYKRHPTLRDNVVVYANATILGGRTEIGEGAVIGSNVWLTKSVEPFAVVVLDNPQHKVKGGRPVRTMQEAITYHI